VFADVSDGFAYGDGLVAFVLGVCVGALWVVVRYVLGGGWFRARRGKHVKK
jgi:hypothetical protein